MFRIFQLFTLVLLLSACTEPKVTSSKSITIVDKTTDHIEPRYSDKKSLSQLNIVIPSELSKIKRLENDFEEKLGFDISFTQRHFFTDHDVLKPSEFDLVIAESNSSIRELVRDKKSLGVILNNKIVLAANKELTKSFEQDGDDILNWSKVQRVLTKSKAKVAITNPGWDIAAHTVWMSWVSDGIENEMEELITFPNGYIGFALDKLLEGKLAGLWIDKAMSNNIIKSYADNGDPSPFAVLEIDDERLGLSYEAFLTNSMKSTEAEAFVRLLKSKETKPLLSEKMFIEQVGSLYSATSSPFKHSDKLTSIDGFLSRNFPKTQTYIAIPKSLIAADNHIENKLLHSFSSLQGQNLNTLETLSKIRELESMNVITYDDNARTVFSTTDLSKENLEDLMFAVKGEPIKENADPYGALLPIFNEAAQFKRNNPDYFVKFILVISDGYDDDMKYAEFAEGYKRLRPSYPELLEIPIDSLVLADANRENLHGIAGLSRGYVIDVDKNQFKRSLLILRNHF